MIWYVLSVIIYFCIMKASFKLCEGLLKKKNRIQKTKNIFKGKTNISLFGTCWIPIIRLLLVIVLYCITFCSDDFFERIINEIEKES